jgi:hypothetical protein
MTKFIHGLALFSAVDRSKLLDGVRALRLWFLKNTFGYRIVWRFRREWWKCIKSVADGGDVSTRGGLFRLFATEHPKAWRELLAEAEECGGIGPRTIFLLGEAGLLQSANAEEPQAGPNGEGSANI